MALLLLLGIIHLCLALPQPQQDGGPDCDIFEACDEDPGPIDCFNTVDDINKSIFDGDTRQAFEDCSTTGETPTTCNHYSAAGFVCAPYWTCGNNTIITDGEGLIDVRSRRNQHTGCALREGTLDSTDKKCPKENEVCCKRPNWKKKPCGPFLEPVTPKEKENFGKCGRSLEEVGLKVTGGDFETGSFAQPGEFPHMCIVYKEENGIRLYVGGASLIARNKLLTVAHKFWLVSKGQEINDLRDPQKFIVRCGEQNVKNEAELLPHQQVTVQKIHIHPDYVPRRVKNNLAILQVKENFVYQKHIGPVCLPGLDSNEFYGKYECWSSGWGAQAYETNGYYSDTLKKIQMPVIYPRTCEDKLKQHPRLKSTFRLDESWICIGGEEGSDTCSGDGGSPHVCKGSKGEFVQVGAVNWGLGCGEAVPSIYSSVPDAMCWIDKLMSCLPEAKSNIDLSPSKSFDPRQDGINVKSVNNFTSEDCGQWSNDYEYILSDCLVEYQQDEFVDQRNTEENYDYDQRG